MELHHNDYYHLTRFHTFQEAFFGKSLLDTSKDKKEGLEISDEERSPPSVLPKGSELLKINLPPKPSGARDNTTHQNDTALVPKTEPSSSADVAGDDPLNFLPQDELLGMLMGDGLGKNGDRKCAGAFRLCFV